MVAKLGFLLQSNAVPVEKEKGVTGSNEHVIGVCGMTIKRVVKYLKVYYKM